MKKQILSFYKYFYKQNSKGKWAKMKDPLKLKWNTTKSFFSHGTTQYAFYFSGKARRGDGNDLTANPKKLAAIGKELDKLNKVRFEEMKLSQNYFR